MVIFNSTFIEGKPIIYPENWGSGKTSLQIHEEWKLTLQYSIISNVLQCLASAMWIMLLVVLVTAVKEIWRLSRLDEMNRERLDNRKYLKRDFLFSCSVLTTICLFVTITLLFQDDWTRMVLLKGVVVCSVGYAVKILRDNRSRIAGIFKRSRKEKGRDDEQITMMEL